MQNTCLLGFALLISFDTVLSVQWLKKYSTFEFGKLIRVLLTYALRIYINKSFLNFFLLEIEKVIKKF